jgi:hypothetical protein
MAVVILEEIRSGEFQGYFADSFLGGPDHDLDVMPEFGDKVQQPALVDHPRTSNPALQGGEG